MCILAMKIVQLIQYRCSSSNTNILLGDSVYSFFSLFSFSGFIHKRRLIKWICQNKSENSKHLFILWKTFFLSLEMEFNFANFKINKRIKWDSIFVGLILFRAFLYHGFSQCVQFEIISKWFFTWIKWFNT